MQDLGPSFSQYGPPGLWITYMFLLVARRINCFLLTRFALLWQQTKSTVIRGVRKRKYYPDRVCGRVLSYDCNFTLPRFMWKLMAGIIDDIQVTRVGMFELHCDELIRALAKRADGLRAKLLQRMSKDHQLLNKRYFQIFLVPLKHFRNRSFISYWNLAQHLALTTFLNGLIGTCLFVPCLIYLTIIAKQKNSLIL